MLVDIGGEAPRTSCSHEVSEVRLPLEHESVIRTFSVEADTRMRGSDLKLSKLCSKLAGLPTGSGVRIAACSQPESTNVPLRFHAQIGICRCEATRCA